MCMYVYICVCAVCSVSMCLCMCLRNYVYVLELVCVSLWASLYGDTCVCVWVCVVAGRQGR